MDDEEIVMTPTNDGKTTRITVEKVKKGKIDESKVALKAGGQHAGLVINNYDEGNESKPVVNPDIQMEFTCFLVNQKTGRSVPERRVLKFWFGEGTDYFEHVTVAYEFFKELVKPDNFPRDYVGFIKRMMKQCRQRAYIQVKRVQVDFTEMDDSEVTSPPTMPSNEQASGGKAPRPLQVQEQLLLTLESAYPNVLSSETLAMVTGLDSVLVCEGLQQLLVRDLVREVEPNCWVRKVLDNRSEVKVIKQMPVPSASEKRPTVAIITAKYYEKLAVDAMMEHKTTFVRYRAEGESNVYTVGDIGPHRVVSTKIPQLGRQMAAQITAGNTVTRLLGTFNAVEHVLLVGVAGGVPHYTDYRRHVRLGDVIVSAPNRRGFVFMFCDELVADKATGQLQTTLKGWAPRDTVIMDTVSSILQQYGGGDEEDEEAPPPPWVANIAAGERFLQGQQVTFTRPSPDTDRLLMSLGDSGLIEMEHPRAPGAAVATPDTVHVKFGTIGSGKPIVSDDILRLDFAARHQCLAFDTEFDQVLESVVGNRKDSFIFIRGVSDYYDGTKSLDWQPFAALTAAAFTKTLIEHLPVAPQPRK